MQRIFGPDYQDLGFNSQNQMVDMFWIEFEEFNSRTGRFMDREAMWTSDLIKQGESAMWHKIYTFPYTKILGCLGCRACSMLTGIGLAERSWGDVKHIKDGKQSHRSGA